jgi:hypothetical protein
MYEENVTLTLSIHCRVIQQRAGEWLLKQLNQMKDTENESVQLKSQNVVNVEGKKIEKF